MKIEGDDVIFSTGKVKDANCGIIGISPSLGVSSGYDDGFFYKREDGEYRPDDYLTKEEQIELADYMIGLWSQFKIAAR